MAQNNNDNKRSFADLGKEEQHNLASKGDKKNQAPENNPDNLASRDDAGTPDSKSREDSHSGNTADQGNRNG